MFMVCMCRISIYSQVPLGVQIATAIRIGQYLGAGQTTEAKTVGRLAITIVGKLLMHFTPRMPPHPPIIFAY